MVITAVVIAVAIAVAMMAVPKRWRLPQPKRWTIPPQLWGFTPGEIRIERAAAVAPGLDLNCPASALGAGAHQ